MNTLNQRATRKRAKFWQLELSVHKKHFSIDVLREERKTKFSLFTFQKERELFGELLSQLVVCRFYVFD